jgi:hypothetical protein
MSNFHALLTTYLNSRAVKGALVLIAEIKEMSECT